MHDKLRSFISSPYRLRSLMVPRFQPADLEDERQLISDLWLDSQSRNAVEMQGLEGRTRCKLQIPSPQDLPSAR